MIRNNTCVIETLLLALFCFLGMSCIGQAKETPDQALFHSIRAHDLHTCSLALQHGANPDAIDTDAEGTPALIAAAFEGDAPIVSLLLAHKAHIHVACARYSKQTPIIAAVNNRSRHAFEGRKATLKVLLDHGADINAA